MRNHYHDRMTSNSFSYLSRVGPILLINTFAPILPTVISTYVLAYNKEIPLPYLLHARNIFGIKKSNILYGLSFVWIIQGDRIS